MRKLKAFTILEVTVSMLIASISIAISYSAYTIINSSYREYDLKNKKISDFTLAGKQLNRDFLNSKIIRTMKNGIALEDLNGTISYGFTDDYIVRNQYGLRTDTLRMPVSGFEASFEEMESGENMLIDKLNITVMLEKEETTMCFSKLYSAEDLIR